MVINDTNCYKMVINDTNLYQMVLNDIKLLSSGFEMKPFVTTSFDSISSPVKFFFLIITHVTKWSKMIRIVTKLLLMEPIVSN